MRVLGIVPARGGSRRVKRKNLVELGGRTLVRRALDTALRSGVLDVIVLSSEDDEILAEAPPGVVALPRAPELATDTALAYDVVKDVLRVMEDERSQGPFDAVAIVQATSPFTAPEDIRGAVELLESTGAGSVVTVAELAGLTHPLKAKRMEGDRLVPFSEDDAMRPSQDLPPVWARNGSVYVSRREVLGRGELVSKGDVRGYPMPPERSHDIDTPLDLEFARFLVERGIAR
jgi:CMP-N-acetylneuraminic acid synthetase